MIVKQILHVTIIGNVKITVWRISISILRWKGLSETNHTKQKILYALSYNLDTMHTLIGQKSVVHLPVYSKKTETSSCPVKWHPTRWIPTFHLLEAFGLEKTKKTVWVPKTTNSETFLFLQVNKLVSPAFHAFIFGSLVYANKLWNFLSTFLKLLPRRTSWHVFASRKL